MSFRSFFVVCVIFGALISFKGRSPAAQVAKPPQSLADQVNEMIGTAAEGQTYPSTGVPFAMTQWTPQTQAGETKCVSPYYIADKQLQGFRGSHFLSGSCAQDYASFTVMPLKDATKLGAAQWGEGFSRQSEVARPYKYSVDLDSEIHAEITGTQRSGIMRFRYQAGQLRGFLGLEDNLRLGHGTIHIDVRRQEITGENPVHRIYAGDGQAAGFSGWVVVRFDRPFEVGGTWSGATRADGATDQGADAIPLGAYVSFTLPKDGVVRVRVGTSFVSLDEARKNLEAEIPDWDFDGVAAKAHAEWDKALGGVEIAGNSPDKVTFYTAMYHAMLLPRIFSDVSETYPKFADGKLVERAQGFTYYCDYSAWDTFRGVHPLFTILQSRRDLDMVKSLIAKGEQGGNLPIFPAWNSYTTEMSGDHTTAIIADAYVKGIRGFDTAAAYRLMRKNALEKPEFELYKNGRGRRALDSYMKYGYIPLEDKVRYAFHANEQVSRTMDYAYDDFEVSVMAKALGHTEDAALFAKRSEDWRNVIDPSVGFARGRHSDGSWVTPFDPAAKASYITESTPFVFTFFVLHDVPGLIDFLGGPKPFEAKLDALFDKGLYDHGNEPSHHIAYLYDAAGVPSKTQSHVHEIMTTLYRNATDGLAGNDDAGQMSAWYVLSAMGFYPVTPGTPRYEIGTPHFDEMVLHPEDGKPLHIVAKGAETGAFYVRSVTLNGVRLDRTYLLHQEIVGGGNLVFEMSKEPVAAE
jgi:predicted alpha-1,2-mannosidase